MSVRVMLLQWMWLWRAGWMSVRVMLYRRCKRFQPTNYHKQPRLPLLVQTAALVRSPILEAAAAAGMVVPETRALHPHGGEGGAQSEVGVPRQAIECLASSFMGLLGRATHQQALRVVFAECNLQCQCQLCSFKRSKCMQLSSSSFSFTSTKWPCSSNSTTSL